MNSASSAERYLQDWHTRFPDAGRTFHDFIAPGTVSSRERLAASATAVSVVADIGCGSGELLRTVRRANPRAVAIGLDLTQSALHAAAAQAPGAWLMCARAQTIPLATASVDCVLSHMALMLMDDPDCILGEIGRVLRADGVFSAVVQQRAPLDAIARTVLAPLRPLWDSIDPARLPPALGDERVTDATGLERLVSEHFRSVAVEVFDLPQAIPRSELGTFLRERFYGLDALPEAQVRDTLRDSELPDPVPWSSPMLHLSARFARNGGDRGAAT